MGTLAIRSKDSPWKLTIPPDSSAYTMHVKAKDGKMILICEVGGTVLHHDARRIADLHAERQKPGDWLELGGADVQKPAKDETVEVSGRPEANPVGGWYELKKGLRGSTLKRDLVSLSSSHECP